MGEIAWVKLQQPYDAQPDTQIGDVFAVADTEELDYLVTNEIAEIVDIEAEHHLQADQEFIQYGVEQDEQIWVMADIPIHLGTNVARWKRNDADRSEINEKKYFGFEDASPLLDDSGIEIL